MKKIFLTLTLSIGVISAATEFRSHTQPAPAAIAPAPDMPPPICWPDCDDLTTSR